MEEVTGYKQQRDDDIVEMGLSENSNRNVTPKHHKFAAPYINHIDIHSFKMEKKRNKLK